MTATLAGHYVTSARIMLPAWGCWFADASLDGEHVLSGRVELKVADLTLSGTILSGGPDKGRSFYRLVGGAGGWGRTIAAESYDDDAGVKRSTVFGDAAKAVGEAIDLSSIATADRLGPRYTRPEGPASRLLELHASKAWYVGDDGVTRLGRRPSSSLPPKVTLGPVDRARRTVTLASDVLTGIRPGLVVEDIEAVDVIHELTPSGLRSTIWGSLGDGGGDRALEAFRLILEQLDPYRRFRGVTEYRVVTQDGDLLNLQPVLVSSGMPELPRVAVRPGVAGCKSDVMLGSHVLVGFINSDPGRPYVASFEDPSGAGFVPLSLDLLAGGMVGGEHLLTVESFTVLIHNIIVGLSGLGLPPTWVAVSGAITGVINAAIAASGTPAPPTEAAQVAAAPAIVTAMLTGPGNTASAYVSAIELALEGKTANESGLFPSIGAKAVRSG